MTFPMSLIVLNPCNHSVGKLQIQGLSILSVSRCTQQ